MVDALTWAASATETDVDTTVEEHFRAYRIPDDRSLRVGSPRRRCATAASSPCRISTGGGSDASAFEAKGLRCLNIANGTEATTPRTSSVSARALETMLDVDAAVERVAAEAVRC